MKFLYTPIHNTDIESILDRDDITVQQMQNAMERQQIIMNFTVPPSDDDLLVIAREALQTLPDELSENLEDDMELSIEEFADDTILDELDVEDAYEMPALFKSAKVVSPGVEKKEATGNDSLILYRRALLDLWCETGDDISIVVRQVMIAEIAQFFDFSDDDIEDMLERHFQGMLD